MTTITLNVENREDIVNALHELANTLDGNIGEISHGMLGASGDTFEIDYDDEDLEVEEEDDSQSGFVYVCPDCGHVYERDEYEYDYNSGKLMFHCNECGSYYSEDMVEIYDKDEQATDFVKLRMEDGRVVFVRGETLSQESDEKIITLCKEKLPFTIGDNMEIIRVVQWGDIAAAGEYQSIL